MEIYKTMKYWLLATSFSIITFTANADWITVESCQSQQYSYMVLVGYTGPEGEVAVYETRYSTYEVCNNITVWTGPGSPDSPPPPPATGGSSGSGQGNANSPSPEDIHRQCLQTADHEYDMCEASAWDDFTIAQRDQCLKLGAWGEAYQACIGRFSAVRETKIRHCRVAKSDYILNVCK